MNATTPKTKCLKRSRPELSSRYQPFYNNTTSRISDNLKLSNPVFEKVKTNGWHTCKQASLEQGCSDYATLIGAKSLPAPSKCSKKIQLHLDKKEKEILENWFGTARWTYNTALDELKNGAKLNQTVLRKLCTSGKTFKEENPWALKTPADIRNNALRDLEKAFNSTSARNKKAKRPPPSWENFQYRTKKDASETILLPKKSLSDGRLYPTMFSRRRLRSAKGEKIPKSFSCDTKLQRNRLGQFFLILTTTLTVVEEGGENQAPKPNVIALDPGSRTFQMGFSSENDVYAFADGDQQVLKRLSKHLDNLKKKIASKDVSGPRKYRLKKAAARMEKRITNLIRDCHHKVAKFLCENFTTILLPKFNTKDKIRREKRSLNKQAARMLQIWSHYSFEQILVHKSHKYPWCEVISVTEEWTTRTCTRCGYLNGKKSEKKLNCGYCGFDCDRDINGARNILLKFLTEHQRAEEIRRWVLSPFTPTGVMHDF